MRVGAGSGKSILAQSSIAMEDGDSANACLVQQAERQLTAALIIGTAWRARQGRQHVIGLLEERHERRCRQGAAIMLQAAWRGQRAWRATLCALKRQHHIGAAIMLQGHIRGYLTRRYALVSRPASTGEGGLSHEPLCPPRGDHSPWNSHGGSPSGHADPASQARVVSMLRKALRESQVELRRARAAAAELSRSGMPELELKLGVLV